MSLRPEDQESLLGLSAKMSEHQKQLADLPHTVKVGGDVRWTCECDVAQQYSGRAPSCCFRLLPQMYPHPDVVECCLVLLRFGESSPSVSESLQQQARDLLRKYGTGASVQKASLSSSPEAVAAGPTEAPPPHSS